MRMLRFELLEEFVAKDPCDSFSRYALALEHVGARRYDEAISHLEKLVELDPNYIAAYSWVALMKR